MLCGDMLAAGVLGRQALLALAASSTSAAAAARFGEDIGEPAYCPVSEITSCAHDNLEKCTPTIWHGIDSLELFELQPLNNSLILIRSLNGSFEDTVGTVVVLPKAGSAETAAAAPGGGVSASDPNPLHCVKAPPISTMYGNCTTTVSATFGDVGKTLTSAVMKSCGIISWINGNGLYGDWVREFFRPCSRSHTLLGAISDLAGVSMARRRGPAQTITRRRNVRVQPIGRGLPRGGQQPAGRSVFHVADNQQQRCSCP